MLDLRSSVRAAACLIAALAWTKAASAADCGPGDITVSVTGGAHIGSYNPFGSVLSKTVMVSVQADAQAGGTCDLALSFAGSTSPSMTGNLAAGLSYGVEANGRRIAYVAAGVPPPPASRIDLSISANGGTATTNIQVNVPTGQVVADGAYVDTATLLYVFHRNGEALTPIKAIPFPVSATVVKACQLSQPSESVLDFTSAIRNGYPNPGYKLTSTFSNVSCTAPTTIRLSGDAMRPAGAPASTSGGFDNFIHWQARTVFGSATAELSTDTASEAVSSAKNVQAGPTERGSFDVSVNLKRGNALKAGSYSGTLTIRLDPNF